MVHGSRLDSRLLRDRNLAVRVARRPRVVAKGAVRPACDFVEQRQVTRIGGLVDDDGVDRSRTSLRLFR